MSAQMAAGAAIAAGAAVAVYMQFATPQEDGVRARAISCAAERRIALRAPRLLALLKFSLVPPLVC